MATGETTQDSLTSVLFGFAKDSLSTWVDLKRQEGQASVAQRIIDAQQRQAQLGGVVPTQYQTTGGPYNVRTGAGMAALPPWLLWVGAGLLIFGGGAVIVRVAKG